MDAQATFERLYRDHAGKVKAYAMRRFGSEVAADEIVSDVYLTVWRRLETVPEDPLPWLLGVARNAVTNRHRSQRRASALHARIAATEPEQITDDLGSSKLLGSDSRVIRALAHLPERDRELLMLVAWESLDPEQLAEALGVSRGTASVRLHRARRRLAAALASDQLQRLTKATE